MKKQFDLSPFDRETKIKVLNALIEGKITKEELCSYNPEEISLLLSNQWALLHISMGDIHSYKFKGQTITKEEYERLDKISKALGIKEISVKVFDTGVPLANSEDEVIL